MTDRNSEPRRAVSTQAADDCAGTCQPRVAPALVLSALLLAMTTWLLAGVPGRSAQQDAAPLNAVPAQSNGLGYWVSSRPALGRAADFAGGFVTCIGLLLLATAARRRLHSRKARTEQRVARTEQVAGPDESRLRELTDSLPQLVWTALPDGTHDYYNKRWHQYTGIAVMTPGESAWQQIIHPDELSLYSDNWKRSVETGEPFHLEYRLRASDGNYHWHLGLAMPLLDEQHNIVRWLGTSTAIGRQKLVEISLDRLRDELEAKVQERTRELALRSEQLEERTKALESFSYSVSHDLRAPLRAISGFAHILSRRHRHGLDADGQHFLDNIVEASAQMGRLIDDLLEYSRIGRTALSIKAVNLSKLLADLARTRAERISEQGARLRIADELPAVQGDYTLLSQIFANLLDNALTYRRPEAELSVEIDWKAAGACVIVSVSDNGIGIDPLHFSRIFEVFQRLHSQDEYPGTGIGLAVVKRSVDLQGGKVWVDSTPGAGSTFFVQLPRATPTEAPCAGENTMEYSHGR